MANLSDNIASMAGKHHRLAFWIGRHFLPIAIAIASLPLGLILYDSLGLATSEFAIQQNRIAALAPADISDKVIVVIVDTADSQKLDGENTNGFVKHHHYADLIRGLRKAGAKSLVLDFTIVASSKREDADMISEIERAGPLQITLLANGDHYVLDSKEPLGRRYAFERPFFVGPRPIANVDIGQGELVDTSDLAGAIPLLAPDHETGTTYEHIALCAFRQLFGIPKSDVTDRPESDAVIVGSSSFQVGPAHDLTIDWPKSARTIPQLSLSEALAALAGRNAHMFEGKVVLVGTSNDRVRNTVRGEMLGTTVVGYALNTMLRQESMRPVRIDEYANYGWSVLLAGLAALSLASNRRSVRLAGPLVVIFVAVSAPVLLVLYGQRILSSILPVVCVGLTLPAALATRAVRPSWYPFLDSSPVEGTVMFVDVVGSTNLVAELGPSRSRSTLTTLLTRASKVVAAHGGEVIRDTGDGLLCLYVQEAGREHACDCLATVEALRAAAAQVAERTGLAISLTFGIESGPVSRSPGSIHGLTVHKAARLQSACREVGVDVLIGPGAKALSEHCVKVEKFGPLQLRGVNESVDVYFIPTDRAQSSTLQL